MALRTIRWAFRLSGFEYSGRAKMLRSRRLPLVIMTGSLLVALVACAPSAPTTTPPAGAARGGEAQPAPPSKTLVIILNSEPETLAGTSMFGRTSSTGGRRRVFNAGLALRDASDQPTPYLA